MIVETVGTPHARDEAERGPQRAACTEELKTRSVSRFPEILDLRDHLFDPRSRVRQLPASIEHYFADHVPALRHIAARVPVRQHGNTGSCGPFLPELVPDGFEDRVHIVVDGAGLDHEHDMIRKGQVQPGQRSVRDTETLSHAESRTGQVINSSVLKNAKNLPSRVACQPLGSSRRSLRL